MKILFSVPRYHPNHDGMVAGLAAAGHTVRFLARSVYPSEAHRVPVDLLGRPGQPARPRGLLPAFRAAFPYLRATRPDLVIARNADSTSYAVYLACRILGIRYLLYVQTRTGYESLSPGRRLRLRLGLWPRHTVNSACATPPPAIPGKTFDFLPFAVEPVGPPKVAYPEAPPLRLLAVAKLDQRRKNLAPLVRAAAPVLREGRASLTLAGLLGPSPDPAYADLLTTIAAEGVGARVSLRPNLPYEDSRRLYAEHDVFLLASSREPAAISPAEAMAAGLPVVCGSDNGTNYLIEPGETGFIFPDGDFEALAAQIDHFVASPSEVARMGRNARARILADFSPDAYARRLMSVVERRFGPVG